MSADNQITVMRFTKASGETVCRMFECSAGGMFYEALRFMSTRTEHRNFLEFPVARYADVVKFAWELDGVLLTEYGVRECESTFEKLRAAAEQHFSSNGTPRLAGIVSKFVEADDAFINALPKGYFVESVEMLDTIQNESAPA